MTIEDIKNDWLQSRIMLKHAVLYVFQYEYIQTQLYYNIHFMSFVFINKEIQWDQIKGIKGNWEFVKNCSLQTLHVYMH